MGRPVHAKCEMFGPYRLLMILFTCLTQTELGSCAVKPLTERLYAQIELCFETSRVRIFVVVFGSWRGFATFLYGAIANYMRYGLIFYYGWQFSIMPT
jgi:hypothetical protein